jgi:hypothetical protein
MLDGSESVPQPRSNASTAAGTLCCGSSLAGVRQRQLHAILCDYGSNRLYNTCCAAAKHLDQLPGVACCQQLSHTQRPL